MLHAISINREARILIVFLHGNSMNGQIYLDLVSQDSLRDFHCLVLDLPGHGLSPRFGCYSLKAILDSIYNEVRNLNFDKIFIVGSSLGGHLAMQMLSILPFCNGVVTIGSPPLQALHDICYAFNPEKSAVLFFEKNRARIISELSCLIPNMSLQFIASTISSFDMSFKNLFETLDQVDFWENEQDVLNDGSIPVLCIIGDEDPFINIDYILKATSFTSKNKISKILIKKGWGHYPFLTYPQEVASIIGDFISRCH